MNTALRLLKHKYTKFVVTGLLFMVWMMFLDKDNWFTHQERIKELKHSRAYVSMLRQDIKEMKQQRYELENDTAVLEKFARENYRLKRDNEDVYVFE